MLCKTTMRAALAPVIGLFGILAAAGASGAISLTDDRGGATDANPPLRYAAESLHTDECFRIGRNCVGYRIVATGTDLLQVTAEVDVALPADGGRYYAVIKLGGAFFARDLVAGDLTFDDAGGGSPTASDQVSADGDLGDNGVIFQLGATPSAGWSKDSVLSINLTGIDANTDGTFDDDEKYAHIYVTAAGASSGAVTMSVTLHSEYEDAIDELRSRGGRTLFETDDETIVAFGKVVRTGITAHVDTADVSTAVADGGPFRRFKASGMGGANSGVLASITTQVVKKGSRSWARDYRNARTGYDITDAILSHLDVTATATAGNFAVATDGGKVIPTNRTPWMVATAPTCGDGPLTLGVVGATIETYQRKACPVGSPANCDGDPDGDDGPLRASDLTPDGLDSANIARNDRIGRSTPDEMTDVATNYFCVLVAGNTDPIDEIGDPAEKDGFSLTVTSILNDADNRVVKPSAEGPDNAGAIDRNGTTVHLTYLSTNPDLEQRLVLVNRGADRVHFWIEDDSFNLEDDTMLVRNDLAVDDGRMIPGSGRLVLTVEDEIEFSGQFRGAATVNVAAPTRDIDVMTIQRSIFTEDVDTTVYQHAGP